jgi:branched-chain amino acid transport system permease protein
VTEFAQLLIDGLGRGGTYALIALGLALVFGVMHLLNFAHGELITVGGYTAYAVWALGLGWWVMAPAAVLAAVLTALVTERIAFRRVRGASAFTMLLTSFGVAILIQALFRMYVSPKPRQFGRPGWIFDRVSVGSLSIENYNLVVMAVTAVTLAVTAYVLQRTTFGIALRAAAEDFDAARLMGVAADRVIAGAFALSGLLAGIAAALLLMRVGQVDPAMGLAPLLKGVVAAIVGGLGSLSGAVVAGFLLGIVEVAFRTWLPPGLAGLTDGFVFALVALLFILRPTGLVAVRHAERV